MHEYIIEIYDNKGNILATIIRSVYEFAKKVAKQSSFVTDPSIELQVGILRLDKGHKIKPHLHRRWERKIERTIEILYIVSGKLRVDFYDEDKVYRRSVIVENDSLIISYRGYHAFEILEESVILEIKQGPYLGRDVDKIYLEQE